MDSYFYCCIVKWRFAAFLCLNVIFFSAVHSHTDIYASIHTSGVPKNQPQREKTYLLKCALKTQNNLCRLIRVFNVHIEKHCTLGYPTCAQLIFWSDCANAQADLNLLWAHTCQGTCSDVAAQFILFCSRKTIPSDFANAIVSILKHVTLTNASSQLDKSFMKPKHKSLFMLSLN